MEQFVAKLRAQHVCLLCILLRCRQLPPFIAERSDPHQGSSPVRAVFSGCVEHLAKEGVSLAQLPLPERNGAEENERAALSIGIVNGCIGDPRLLYRLLSIGKPTGEHGLHAENTLRNAPPDRFAGWQQVERLPGILRRRDEIVQLLAKQCVQGQYLAQPGQVAGCPQAALGHLKIRFNPLLQRWAALLCAEHQHHRVGLAERGRLPQDCVWQLPKPA